MSRRVVKFNDRRKKEFLDALRTGSRRGAAAESVGVTRQTVWYAMQDDTGFAEAVEQAEMDANELVEDALYQAAQSGNVVACQVWLYNRMPARWKDQRNMQVSTPPGQAFEVSHRPDLSKLSDEELTLLERIIGAATNTR